ncbi:MAG TPA: hypothetical protein VHX67_07680 [Acidimicrobiales bacterium]|jgi:hypothetical protein|nr:hypothetical protein [Acidimicrobiales bacterium]
MTIRRLALVAVAACFVAGCASPSSHPTSSPTTHARARQATQTTLQPPSTAGSGIARPGCGSGTVTVTAAPGPGTPVCVTVGSRVVLRGGYAGSGGTWPGPPRISDTKVVSLASSHSAGDTFTATVKALAAESTTVIVPFVAGADACDPTPCTPVPGEPLNFAVRVIS